MQFLPATFTSYARPIPPGGADPPSPYDPVDAVHAAARYLCQSGARTGDLRAALFTYNHSTDYVNAVLAVARRYAAAAAPADAGDAAAKAVAFARAQLGVPYVWGGDGPAEGGFDCSGLTRAAYATAGISIPRTADTQWRHGPTIPTGQPLQPGDLLFYGTPARATHVTLYVGDNQVIHAPYRGQPVQYATVWTNGFLGATRPTADN
jgi:cell wall-associated NlpC family hydrolase